MEALDLNVQRAQQHMESMSNLTPMIESTISEAISAKASVDQAGASVNRVMQKLIDIQQQIVRLELIRDADTEDPARAIREALRVEDIIRQFESESFVYFIEAGDYIKIGFSHDPIIRLGQIRGGHGSISPEGLSTKSARILAVEQGGIYDEGILHRRFAEYRVAGEWFKKNDRLARYIQSISSPA
ncbi:MAG TPA: hypothetical protein DEW39_04235 [Brevibacterium sp.]|uniref:Meiotically up-regulated gene 113 n=2 Tax=Brevibacteriaceae TaxID=85019 RepID=A0A2H1KD95_9MICO|nr:hypothetical protein BANT918_02348 [Brevibacterium antiquum CNRZ 918]HCG55365.1 hypothetical protein [Brevibacterium sp.]